MLQQLILLVDSVEFGKKILYQIPEHISQLVPNEEQQLQLPEFLAKFVQNCNHFGVVNRQHVALGLDEEVFMNYFCAHEKNHSVCLCIQDDIVITQSAFFTHRLVLDDEPSEPESQLPINSINLIGITNKYENVETIKQMISFFVSVLVYNENNLGTLAQELATIMRHKELFVAEVKGLTKLDSDMSESTFAGKTLDTAVKHIRQLLEKYLKEIQLFMDIRELFDCVNTGRVFEFKKEVRGPQMQFRINTALKCTQIKKEPSMMHKTLLFSNKRAKEFLGVNGSTSKRLEKVLSVISPYRSLEQVGIQHKISQSQIRNVVGLILANNLGLCINPINAYTKYALCLTNKHPKSKFQQRYQQNYVQILKQIERTGQTQHTKQLLFLLVNGVVRQSQIFVFNPNKKAGSLNYLREILLKYALTGISLQEIARLQDTELKLIVRYIHENPGDIVVYAVQ